MVLLLVVVIVAVAAASIKVLIEVLGIKVVVAILLLLVAEVVADAINVDDDNGEKHRIFSADLLGTRAQAEVKQNTSNPGHIYNIKRKVLLS